MPEGVAKGTARRRRSRRQRRTTGRRGAFATTFLILALVTAVGTGLLLFGAARYMGELPTLDAIKARQIGANSSVYDATGAGLGVLASEENRQPVPADAISPWMKKATVAIEDRRFYDHAGVDARGIARAAVRNLAAGRVVQGGSTLTQQLISQIYIVKERTFDRKLREALLALQLEQRFTKDEILTAYLNTVFYGNNAYGVEAAAQTYFAKPAKDLTIAEAALLAGLPQLPSYYDPYANPESALARRTQVLQAMRDTGQITAAQQAKADRAPLDLKRGRIYGKVRESFFVRYVADELAADPDFGDVAVRAGGLRIETTLDPRLQGQARKAMKSILKSPGDPDAAIVAIRPKTGEIVAMASTRYFRKDQFDLASQGRRQPGSTFKTFTLATAVEQGIDPRATRYMSAPFSWQPDPQSAVWQVGTAGGRYSGGVTLENATLASDNTVYAQLAIDVGAANIADMARRLGVRQSELVPVPSITLGSSGVSPLEMTIAYATLANGGVYNPPTAIRAVGDADGNELLGRRNRGVRVIQDGVAAEVTRILGENMYAGTGTGARTTDGRPQAGKTGTTDDNTDAWFCGYTPDLAACVWIGFPDETRPLYNVAGVGAVSGPTLPADIWHLFMDAALADVPPRQFRAPREPVAWESFTSQFADRIVSSVTAPDVQFTAPKPKPEPETTPEETAPAEPDPVATTAPAEPASAATDAAQVP
ncbi:MAG: transglycosylase domain-containing protein [Gaiellales bacterium]